MTRTCLTTALVFAACPAHAADWPQFQGPDRNNVSRDTGLLKTWPANGPKLLLGFTPDRRQAEVAIDTLGAPQLVDRSPDPLGLLYLADKGEGGGRSSAEPLRPRTRVAAFPGTR